MEPLPKIVAVSGFSSNVGKTTLVCELLRHLPSWEAIKLTRGHYRSCGRDPAGCCVSDLLREEPVVRSGYEANYQLGKDTGRFWEAGASNVHWVIVKDGQVEQGINLALSRVKADGVGVEGNSFLEYVRAGDDHVRPRRRREDQALVRNGSTLLSLSYDYTNASDKRTGQLTKIYNNQDHGKDRSHSYDALGRLVLATGGPSGSFWTESYSYDRYGKALTLPRLVVMKFR